MKHLRMLTILLLLFVSRAYAENDSTGLEYRLKAVVLFNFTKYVHWPEKQFQSDKQSIRICILGENPFGDLFQSDDAPKEAQNRPLQLVELPASATKLDVANCQLLYWTSKNEAAIGSLLPTLQEHAVLTVADEKSQNALISFAIEDKKIRFIIRHKQAQELGLEISSQLLKLAILDE